MKRRSVLSALMTGLMGGLLFTMTAFAQQPAAKTMQLSLANKPWKGDFDQMLERRMIRVLIPYSRTLYFVDKGRERGVAADLVREFEQYLNKKYAKQLGKRPLTIYMIATTRDKLLSGLGEGLGDIAVGNLTATDERRRIVDFIAPTDRKPLQELIVTGPSSPPVATLDDLSGKTIHVRKSSSYYESVLAHNKHLAKTGKAPMKIVELSDVLEDEDTLEMLNSGLLEIVVVDDWKARMWAQILPKIKVREDLVLRAEGYPGWAVRKNSPGLIDEATNFYQDVVKKQGTHAARLARYHKQIKQIHNNTGGAEWKRFEQAVKLFEKYGAKYSFDPLMLAAQGYQESRLRQEARSHVGAIGVMQIMPATGKDLNVGDIHEIESNIHGGTKYMNQLMTRYFPDAKFTEEVRPLFAFASYNAGPGAISKMRKDAAKRGLDPDKWFNNVEIVVAERIGLETTTYVRNIYKYYTAYKLTVDAQEAQRKAREQLTPVKR
jgi:membrane-bound lytic murein transglycosylase MltF